MLSTALRTGLRRCPSVLSALAVSAALALSACSPLTVVNRVAEDRSSEDIAEDNRIVLAVNKLMAKYETVSVSTEIYEQRLLVYGILSDPADYRGLRNDVGKVEGVRALYWHVEQMSESEREAQEDEMIGFAEGLKVETAIETDWLDADGVASLNYRIAVDPFGTAYVLGRAASAAERERALAVVRDTDEVERVVDYVVVR